MSNDSKSILAGVLKALDDNAVRLDKIVIHKFMYFLNTQGFNTGFRFEPYTYGPFSFDLANAIGAMDFWDAVKEKRYSVEIVDIDEFDTMNQEGKQRIEEFLRTFQSAVGDFTFKNLECAGTILYCAETLGMRDKPINQKTVEEEFRGWKGERYTSAEISDMFSRLEPYLKRIQ